MSSILFFGDSITVGEWDEQGGWVARTIRNIYAYSIASGCQRYVTAYNLGIDGDTSTSLAHRISAAVQLRRWNDDPLVVVVAIGLNDVYVDYRKENVSDTVERYRENLDSIAEAVQSQDTMLFIGPTPVNESVIAASFGRVVSDLYHNEEIQEIDAELTRFCGEWTWMGVSLFTQLKVDPLWPSQLIDGIHPNTDGHAHIYDLVRDPIMQMVEALPPDEVSLS